MSAGGWSLTSCSNNQAVFATSSQSGLTQYTVTVTTSVKDSHGNPMASNYQFSYTTSSASNNTPALEWVTGYTCLAEGVRPGIGANGADFNFRVKYKDSLDGDCPDANGVKVVVNGTTYTLTQNDGASCQTGREYYDSVTINTVGNLNYSFNAKDSRGADATGVPISDHVVSVLSAYKVRPTGGTGWYSTIADALTASPASSTVLVYPNADFTAATYAGGLSNINKTNRTLQSVCGADLTVISGGGTVYNLQGNDGAVIDGFTITGGTTYGIYSNADSLTVKNSKIHSNPTGIHLNNGCNPVSIQTTSIYSNTSYGINSPSTLNLVSIANSNIYNNGGGTTNGAGISLNGGAGTHTIDDSSFTGNTTTGNGGAIYCVNCVVTIDDSTINNNKAGSGGAIYFLNPSVNATITDTFIQGNEATGTLGGAIYMGNGTESLTNVMLTGNKANTNGGAIYVNGGTTNSLFCTMSGNYAGGYGGALYQNSSTQTTIQNSIIYNNDALNGGNYKQIFATSPRYTYVDVYYSLINQIPGANISGPPDQRCSYEDMGGNNTTGNPNFVSGGATLPHHCPPDYRRRLPPASPPACCQCSEPRVGHQIDIFGGSRPLGGAYDMGVNEKEDN
jgi:predicted outer membrane repeat protein